MNPPLQNIPPTAHTTLSVLSLHGLLSPHPAFFFTSSYCHSKGSVRRIRAETWKYFTFHSPFLKILVLCSLLEIAGQDVVLRRAWWLPPASCHSLEKGGGTKPGFYFSGLFRGVELMRAPS